MSVKLPGSETWSFHGISCLPLNFKDDFCSLLLTFKLGRLNKLTGNELFARNHKILSSNLLMIPQTTQERIQNFWPPNNTGDSEFLTTKQHRRGFRISDPQTEHWRFRISDPQTTQQIQNFWPPNNTGEDSEFLTPKLNTGDSEFQIPQTRQERIQNFWFPKQKYNTGRFSIFQNP